MAGPVPNLALTEFWGESQHFAQPHLSRSNGGHPQQDGTNLGVFVPIWLVLPWCEAINLGLFDLYHFALLKRGLANLGGFGARSLSSSRPTIYVRK